MTEEEQLDFLEDFMTADLKAVKAIKGSPQIPNTKFTDKEQTMQNKIDMLQKHNDLLMNEIDRKG